MLCASLGGDHLRNITVFSAQLRAQLALAIQSEFIWTTKPEDIFVDVTQRVSQCFGFVFVLRDANVARRGGIESSSKRAFILRQASRLHDFLVEIFRQEMHLIAHAHFVFFVIRFFDSANFVLILARFVVFFIIFIIVFLRPRVFLRRASDRIAQ